MLEPVVRKVFVLWNVMQYNQYVFTIAIIWKCIRVIYLFCFKKKTPKNVTSVQYLKN